MGLGLMVNNFAFAGCIKGDCKNGQGTYIETTGFPVGMGYGYKYVGEWKDGKEHGQGTKIYPGGAKYVGEFRNGSIHGLGTYVGVHEALSIKYSRVRGCLLMQCQGLWNDANLVEYYDIEKFKLVERNNIKTQITKKEKKKKEKKTDNSNISKQLKTLNNLYKSGALTKEEFEKAKKKLLN